MSMTLNFLAHSFERGRRLQEAGNPKQAARFFEHLAHHPDLSREVSLDALLSLGQFRLELGEVSAARQTLSAACEKDPTSAAAHFALAEACLEGDDADLERAYEALCEAVELDPEAAPYRAELGKVQLALGMDAEGFTSLETAIELKPGDTRYLRDLVDALMDIGEEDQALVRVRQAVFANPHNPGFQALWNDLRFCMTADQLDVDAETEPRTVAPSSQHILKFPTMAESGSAEKVPHRTIRHDAAAELPTPHKHLPFVRTDRRRA
jgi:tetratricopeptide (TPR) repeat protein